MLLALSPSPPFLSPKYYLILLVYCCFSVLHDTLFTRSFSTLICIKKSAYLILGTPILYILSVVL